MHRLIICHNDQRYAEWLLNQIRVPAWSIYKCRNYRELSQSISRTRCDLVLMQDQISGFDLADAICRITTKDSNMRILVICDENDDTHKIKALDAGADDCVSKSCSPGEIRARAQALTRRHRLASNTVISVKQMGFEITDAKNLIRFYGWTLDFINRTLLSPAGIGVHLTTVEYNTLFDLVSHPGVIRGRHHLRGPGTAPGNREIEARSMNPVISRLRKKLAAHGTGHFIETVAGMGYRFLGEVEYI